MGEIKNRIKKIIWRAVQGEVNERVETRINEFRNEIRCQIDFLTYETHKNLERHRWEDYNKTGDDHIIDETKESFDYQWNDINTGKNLPSDKDFMKKLKETICTYMGGVDEGYFADKKIADVGCGMGRFTYGFLSMGATVTAMDQSEHGLQKVAQLCDQWRDRLTTKRIDLIHMDDVSIEQYDIVWCYGVVHHTGNTYLAMSNVLKMVKPNGIVFMMIYGYPESGDTIRYSELANYEHLREVTRNMTNKEKVDYLRGIYPEELVHGYFDAISPHINDILSFEEIKYFMSRNGFGDIKRTFDNANIHFVAVKKDLQ